MPELPEVENIRLTLLPYLPGRRIEEAEVYLDRVIKHPGREDFVAGVTGAVVGNILRRGKYLLLDLDNDKLLAVHLRMTGALIAGSREAPPYARIKFSLSGGHVLWYTDVRTLGTLYLVNKGENIIKGLREMGPEPLRGQLDPLYFRRLLAGRGGAVKGVLLDQAALAGLGNIYADEALALAGLRPDRPASSLNEEEGQKLFEAVLSVVEQGIANGGTSFRDYKDGEGKKGRNQEYLLVYGRRGQPCRMCGAPLSYGRVAGRGTSFCPHCQK